MNKVAPERPIIFSSPMVSAIIDGRKTQTRRVVKPQPEGRAWFPKSGTSVIGANLSNLLCKMPDYSPYGQPGDRLRVKEAAWMWCERMSNGKTKTGRAKWHYVPLRDAPVHYAADHPAKPRLAVVSPDTGNQWGWRLKIGRFLPAWAIRLELEIAGVRVERLQDISAEDAIAEGLKALTKDGRLTKYGIPDRDGLPGTDDTGCACRCVKMHNA